MRVLLATTRFYQALPKCRLPQPRILKRLVSRGCHNPFFLSGHNRTLPSEKGGNPVAVRFGGRRDEEVGEEQHALDVRQGLRRLPVAHRDAAHVEPPRGISRRDCAANGSPGGRSPSLTPESKLPAHPPVVQGYTKRNDHREGTCQASSPSARSRSRSSASCS